MVTKLGYEVRGDSVSFRPLHILRECPKTFITDFSREALELYSHSSHHNNALPNAGGLMDQNAVVMEAFAVIRDEVGKFQKWRERTEKAEEERQRAVKGKGRARGR